MMTLAPLLLDYLSEEERNHFARVQDLLLAAGVNFQINPRMVRGLDYYTGTTFEFVHPLLGAQSGIGGGGRYDGLMSELGGDEHSGIGFGLGIDRILLAQEAEQLSPAKSGELDLFLISMVESTKRETALIMNALRSCGIHVDMAYGDRSLKGSMKAADKSGARLLVVMGDDEISSGVVRIKRMHDGEQESIKLSLSNLNEIIEKCLRSRAGEK
jgi:histidyl-tRNA synthetase